MRAVTARTQEEAQGYAEEEAVKRVGREAAGTAMGGREYKHGRRGKDRDGRPVMANDMQQAGNGSGSNRPEKSNRHIVGNTTI